MSRFGGDSKSHNDHGDNGLERSRGLLVLGDRKTKRIILKREYGHGDSEDWGRRCQPVSLRP